MTNTILKKMKEKEKKPDRKSVPEKGMKRNKTTVNFNRNKLDKSEKDKPRKSFGSKAGGDKKSKTISTTVRTEGNEKKEKDKKDKLPKITSKKELLSKSMGGKTLSKSKTLSSLTSQKKPPARCRCRGPSPPARRDRSGNSVPVPWRDESRTFL